MKNYHQFSARVICLVLSFLLTPVVANAMSVEPMVLDIISVGTNAKTSFKVSNDSTAPLPIEIGVSRMDVGADGESKYAPAPDAFLIYPPQAIIPKGSAQVFRVQWIGEPELTKSQSYRLSVSQLPLQLPKGQSGIQIIMSFGVVVSVSPVNGKAAITVTGAKPAKSESGKLAIALTVKNPGNKHAYMRDAAISLSAGNWYQELSASEVGQRVGIGIVQPGKERRFLIPVDLPPGVSDITASIDYQPAQ